MMPQFLRSVENQFIVQCVLANFKERHTNLLHFCNPAQINWENVLQQAMRHGVAGLVYRSLANQTEVVVPSTILEQLKYHYYTDLSLNIRLLSELQGILTYINTAGAKVIILKGAALAQTVYPNITLRTFVDIDLLIKPHDWPVIKEILVEMGFTPERNYDALRVEDLWDYTYNFRTINFIKDNYFPLSIDIHCNSIHIGRSRAEAPMLWDRAIEIKMDNIKGFGLCPEDLLLHLCVHLNFHNYEELRWFADIYAVVKHYSKTLDWTRLIREVRGKGIALPLYYGLLYTKYLLDCPLPLEVLKELQPNWLLRKRFEFFWNENKILQHKSKPHSILGRGLIWFIVDRFQDKLKYIFRMLFPPISWLRCHYSLPKTKKNYLFYFQHLANILKSKL